MTAKTPLDSFTPREEQVIELLEQGRSNKEIARKLGITTSTVEAHLGSIYARLGVTSRTRAVIKLRERSSGISSGRPEVSAQGNPQLKTDAGTVILNSKDIQYRYFYKRPKTKTVRRLVILALLALLIIVIIVAIFSSMRSGPAAYFIP